MATITKGGVTLTIVQDFSPTSPREWDNLGTIIHWHSRYEIGDKNVSNPREALEEIAFETSPEGTWRGDFEEKETKTIKSIIERQAIVLPLYIYDHSGVILSTGGFSCPWDSGQVGYVYVSKAKVREEYKVKRITKKVLEQVKNHLAAEVETFSQYISGDVWGFKLESEDGEHIDSCWGFFGSDPQTNGMIHQAEEKYHPLFEEIDF